RIAQERACQHMKRPISRACPRGWRNCVDLHRLVDSTRRRGAHQPLEAPACPPWASMATRAGSARITHRQPWLTRRPRSQVLACPGGPLTGALPDAWVVVYRSCWAHDAMVWLARTTHREQGGQQTTMVVREAYPACGASTSRTMALCIPERRTT